MFILYFYSSYHEYYHARWYEVFGTFDNWRPGEGAWLVPGTDPDDPAYGRFDEPVESDDISDISEEDETLDYMCDLLEAHEIEPSEFRRQMRSEGYDEEIIRLSIRDRRPDYVSLVDAR